MTKRWSFRFHIVFPGNGSGSIIWFWSRRGFEEQRCSPPKHGASPATRSQSNLPPFLIRLREKGKKTASTGAIVSTPLSSDRGTNSHTLHLERLRRNLEALTIRSSFMGGSV